MQNSQTHTIDDLLLHSGWVRGLSRGLLGSSADADDLAQETWLAALIRGPEREGDPSDARRWLGRVLRNRAATTWRAGEARRVREEIASRPEALPSAAELAERADLSRVLVKRVLALPEESRVMLLLRFYEGLSSAEIARRLGRPATTVRDQVQRALVLLRQQLDADGVDGDSNWRAVVGAAAVPLAQVSTATLVLSTAGVVSAAIAAVAVVGGLWWFLQRGGPPVSVPPTIVAAQEEQTDAASTEPESLASANAAPQQPLASDLRTSLRPVDPTPLVVGLAVRGVLLDTANGAPIPWYEFGVTASLEEAELGDVELVGRTDADGTFQLDPGLPEGQLWFVRLEDRRRAETELRGFRAPPASAPIAFEHTASEAVSITFAVGPTFELECPDLAKLGLPAAAVFTGAEWTPEHGAEFTHVVEASVMFVRFAPFSSPTAKARAERLCVATLDGRWAGYAPIEFSEDERIPLVKIDLVPAANLEVHIDYGRGAPATFTGAGVWAGAFATEKELEGQPLYWFGVFQDGAQGGVSQMWFHFIPVGTATFHTGTNHYTPCVDVLELKQGDQTHNAELERLVFGEGLIKGVVRSTFGQPEVAVEAYLTRVAGGGSTLQSLDLEFTERDGEWLAEFTLDRLSHELYKLQVSERGAMGFSQLEVEPKSFEGLPDGPPVEFTWHPTVEKRRVTVRALDATTGRRVKSFQSRIQLPNGLVDLRPIGTTKGRVKHQLSGDLAGGIVHVAAPGFRPAHVELPSPMPKKGATVKVQLEPGWGGFLRATIGEQPTPGLRVLADKVEVGFTDEDGLLELALDKRPDHLWVEHPEHRVVRARGGVDADGRLVGMEHVEFWEYFDFQLEQGQ